MMTGVLTGAPAHYERLSARQNLTFYATIYGVPDAEIAGRTARVLRFFLLGGRARRAGRQILQGHEAAAGAGQGADTRTPGPLPGRTHGRARPRGVPAGARPDPGACRYRRANRLSSAPTTCMRPRSSATASPCSIRGGSSPPAASRELSEQLWQTTPVYIEFPTPPLEAAYRQIAAIPGVSVLDRDRTCFVLRIDRRRLVPEVVSLAVRNGGAIVRVDPREYNARGDLLRRP